jgi:tetratricopeptide (TPR) repeat protein
LIAGLDAEQAMGRLQPVVLAMAQAVRRFDGTILRTLGDGLKAAFGVPRTQERHALLACRAALAMQEAIAALPNAPPIRIGIHSGEVVAGALDTGSAVEQEAQGMTVHLANRIEQLAEPGTICLSRETRALVGAYCATVPLGPHALKGIAEPVEVFRLTGLRPALASDVFRDNELGPLRDRLTEMRILQDALLAAEAGTASAIGISAPAGIGKSRLCYECSEWCRQRGVYVLEARAHVFGQATPLQPVLEMLRAFFQISQFDAPDRARQNIRDRLLELDDSFATDLPLVFEFLGCPLPDAPPVQPLEPRARHVLLRDIVRRMVKVLGRRTSVILIEDLHWLDDASAEFVETMVDAVAGAHTLMVLNFRPGWTARWMTQPHYRELRLGELDESDTQQVVLDLIGDAPQLSDLVARIVTQSGGNPFFAEELVLSLVQSGVLVGERGRYRLAADAPGDLVLPATVEAVIGARLDRLDEREKTLLQIGAVIGKEFPLAVVQQVARISPEEATQMLGHLSDAELIQPCKTAVGPGFTFRHPMLQEVAYAMQLRARRARLHASVAESIEGFEWGKHDEFAGLLAHHCEAAGKPFEAAMHLQRAARWMGRTNSAQAFAHWKKVRWLLRDQPRSDTNDRLRALASGQILNFGWREGIDPEEAAPYAEEALRYAREAGNRQHVPLLLGLYGRILALGGAADEYVRLVREALVLVEEDGDPERIALVNAILSQAYWLAGQLREALAANDVALETTADQQGPDGKIVLGLNISQLLGFDVEYWSKCRRARMLVWLGRFDEAEQWLTRVLQVEPERIDPHVQFSPHTAGVELAWHLGDARLAEQHVHMVDEYLAQSPTPYLHVVALGCHGLAACTAGDFPAAEQKFRDALELGRRAKAGLEFEARLLAQLADTQYRAGKPRLAAETAAEAIDVARRRSDRLGECHATIVAAAAQCASGQPAEAVALCERAEALLHITGAAAFEPMLARTRQNIETSRK